MFSKSKHIHNWSSSCLNHSKSLTVGLPHRIARKINVHDAEINCIQTSNEGRLLATGSNDQRVKLIDAKSGKYIP